MNKAQIHGISYTNGGKGTEWAETLNDMKHRSHYSYSLAPNLGSNNWKPGRSEALNEEAAASDVYSKPQPNSTSSSLSVGNSLPYSWKRSDGVISHIKQATDRNYRHTYGDQTSAPFELNMDKELPTVRQKTQLKRCLKSKTATGRDSTSTGFSLPTGIAAKIYDNLHQQTEDKGCLYVIKNLRRATPATKPANLPTIIPFYNIQLVKSVSKVFTEEVFKIPAPNVEENQWEALHRPMAAERKYYSPASGNLVKSLGRSNMNSAPKVVNNYDIPKHMSSSRMFRSADAYNKLLAVRHANKMVTSKIAPNDVPITSSNLRHPTAKMSFQKEDDSDDAEDPPLPAILNHQESQAPADCTTLHPVVDKKSNNMEVLATKHITSVRVYKRGTRSTVDS